MNLREWLVVLGGVVIAGIVIDGIRRMRRARRDSMEISLGMGGEIENTPLDEGFNPELPNGGARSVGNPYSNDTSPIDVSDSDSAPSVDISERIEPSLEVGRTSSVQFDDENLSSARVVSREPKVTSSHDFEVTADAGEKVSVDAGEIRATKPESSTEHARTDEKKPKSKMTFGEGLKATSSKSKPSKAKSKHSKSAAKPAQEVIILNVMSKTPAEGFKGHELKTLLEACGVEHGEMSIFHRHESAVDSPVQFSVANAVEPGYFPKDQLDTMATPGISFFMSLPGPEDSMRAFDYMVETAQCVVRNLSGEMKDERRSDMTPQTLEHCRQRIRDFERRQLAAKC